MPVIQGVYKELPAQWQNKIQGPQVQKDTIVLLRHTGKSITGKILGNVWSSGLRVTNMDGKDATLEKLLVVMVHQARQKGLKTVSVDATPSQFPILVKHGFVYDGQSSNSPNCMCPLSESSPGKYVLKLNLGAVVSLTKASQALLSRTYRCPKNTVVEIFDKPFPRYLVDWLRKMGIAQMYGVASATHALVALKVPPGMQTAEPSLPVVRGYVQKQIEKHTIDCGFALLRTLPLALEVVVICSNNRFGFRLMREAALLARRLKRKEVLLHSLHPPMVFYTKLGFEFKDQPCRKGTCGYRMAVCTRKLLSATKPEAKSKPKVIPVTKEVPPALPSILRAPHAKVTKTSKKRVRFALSNRAR